MHYALLYDVTDDYLQRRPAFRDEHLALVRAAHERGELLMGGAFSEPADGALLIWNVGGSSVVEDFVRQDPYVTNGLVTGWRIRPWTVVIGAAD